MAKLISGNLFLKRGAGGGHRASKISYGTAQSAFGYVFHPQPGGSGGVGDTTAPAAPLVIFPADEAILDDATFDVTGTAEVGSTVTLLLDGDVIGTDVADGGGNWSISTPSIANGVHQFSATAKDIALNVSSATLVDFRVDTLAPTFAGVVSVEQDPEFPQNLLVTWNAATDGGTLQADIIYNIYLALASGGQNFGASPALITAPGLLEYSLGNLDESTEYFVVVRAQDQAGNEDTNTVELSASTGTVEDTTPPTFAGVASAVGISSTENELEWVAATDNVSDSGDIVYDVWQSLTPGIDPDVDPPSALGLGSTIAIFNSLEPDTTYYYVVRARDEAGNVDTNTVEMSATTEAVLEAPEVTAQIWNPDWQAVFITGPARTQAEYQFDFGAAADPKMLFDRHVDASNIVSTLKIRIDGAQKAVFFDSDGDPGPEQVNEDHFDEEVSMEPGVCRIQFEWNTLEGAVTEGNVDYWIDPRMGGEYWEYVGISNVRFYDGAELIGFAAIDHVVTFLDSTGTPSGPLPSDEVWFTRTLLGTPSIGDEPYNTWYSWPVSSPSYSLVWIDVQPETIERDRGGVIALDSGEVLVVGGYNNSEEYLDTANLYQESTSWNRISAGTITGEGGDDPLLATFFDEPDDVLLAGGVGEEYFITTRVSIYTRSLNSWAAAADLPAPREHGALIALNDNRVLCIGGNPNSDTLFPKVNTTYSYSRSGNSWSTLGNLNTARDDFACVKLQDGKVMVLGGYTGAVYPPTALASCEIFNPGSNTWATVAPMANAGLAAATVLPDGKVLAITNNGDYQVYDPGLDSWTSPSNFGISGGRSWVFTDPSGVALAINSGDTYVYDPGTDAWSTDPGDAVNFPNPNSGRYVHTGLQYVLFGLPDGDLQVARTTGAG